MTEDRISRLSKRFHTHSTGRPPSSNRTRERRSFYLDAELVDRLDKTYRDLNHQLYPANVSKSVFLESLIEYGLNNIADLKEVLAKAQDIE